jgi:hypothetical protein
VKQNIFTKSNVHHSNKSPTMKHDHPHANVRSAGRQLEPASKEFTFSAAAAIPVAGTSNDRHPVARSRGPSGNSPWRAACQFLLLGLFFMAAQAQGGPVVIGYTNCPAVKNYSQAQMDEIGQLKWYFTHASVGENMMIGVAALHATNAGFYQLHGVAATNTPPAVTQAGVIYEYDRGNPGWWQKCDIFKAAVTNGWRYPRVNIVMNKLCFIDYGADVASSIDYLFSQEPYFPETMYVYMTMPLTTSQDSANYSRNLYNDTMRGWCRTNNRVLFDVADIEAHDTNGAPCTFTYSGRVCQYLCPAYNASSDGGHPDSPYAQKLLASGFYALAGALMSVDRDGDRVSDGQELIAGTLPRDSHSVFKLVNPVIVAPGTVLLQWNSSSNRFYTLQRSSLFNPPLSFTSLLVDAPATPPMNTYTDSPPIAGSFVYRVSVRQ